MKPRFALALGFSLAVFTARTAFAETVWLDDLNLAAATQGWGDPHKNQSVEGHPLAIGGKKFARGFGTHAESILRVNLAGGAEKFSASVGVDDEVNGNPAASVEFFVTGDGRELWNSGVMHAGDAAKECDVELAGVKSLVLKVGNAGDGIDFDHADWADAKFETASATTFAASGEAMPAPVAPYILTPPDPATPRINGQDVFGVRPGSPFLFTIPATGERPMTFSIEKLPANIFLMTNGAEPQAVSATPPGWLELNPSNGQVTGKILIKGEFNIVLRAKNSLGTAEKKFRIVCRRPDCAHAADGLEQLELFCRRGFGGKGQERGGRDGQERPHQPRLDLHQRGRLLAEPSQLERPDVAGAVPRHQRIHRAEQTLSRHERHGGLYSQPRS